MSFPAQRKPALTEAEKAYFRTEFDRFMRTGVGIDPGQDALYHREQHCRCHFCAGTEIRMTAPKGYLVHLGVPAQTTTLMGTPRRQW